MSVIRKILNLRGWRWVIGIGVFCVLCLLVILAAQPIPDEFFDAIFDFFSRLFNIPQ